MAGDIHCRQHGFTPCTCKTGMYKELEAIVNTHFKPEAPQLTPAQATMLYQLMASAVVGEYWHPVKEEYDALKTVLWAISENKEC